jgi:hypothetical protein
LADVDALLDSTPSMPTVIREEIRKNAAKEVYQAWLMKAGPDAGVQAEEIIKQRQAAELGRPKDGLPGAFGETAAPRASGVNNEATGRMGVGGEVYKYFLGKGLQPHQAAAIAGNMAWEGGGKSDLVNPGDNWRNSPGSPHSVGIGQWNDRVPALIRFAREQGIDIPQGSLTNTAYAREVIRRIPLQTQLDFAWQEMQTSEANAGRGVQSAGDIRSATGAAIGYHRPAGWTRGNPEAGHGFSGRLELANQIMRQGGEGIAQAAPQTTADYFRDMVVGTLPAIKRQALIAERRIEADERRAYREDQENVAREGLDLLYGKSLTKEWLETNKARLSNSDYRRFGNALNPRPRATDAAIHAELLERADEDPKTIMERAAEEYTNGRLDQDAFTRIYGKAQRALKEETKLPPWATEQRALIKKALRPDARASDAERKAYTDALQGFDDFIEEQRADDPKRPLDRKVITDYAAKSIADHKINRVTEARKGLTLPKFTQVGREAMTMEEYYEALQRTVGAAQSGKLVGEELKTETAKLFQWQKTLEAEYVANGKPIPPNPYMKKGAGGDKGSPFHDPKMKLGGPTQEETGAAEGEGAQPGTYQGDPRGEPREERGFLAPLVKPAGADKFELGVPGILYHPFQAAKQLLSPEGQYRPGAQDEEGVKLGMDAAGLAVAAGLSGRAFAGMSKETLAALGRMPKEAQQAVTAEIGQAYAQNAAEWTPSIADRIIAKYLERKFPDEAEGMILPHDQGIRPVAIQNRTDDPTFLKPRDGQQLPANLNPKPQSYDAAAASVQSGRARENFRVIDPEEAALRAKIDEMHKQTVQAMREGRGLEHIQAVDRLRDVYNEKYGSLAHPGGYYPDRLLADNETAGAPVSALNEIGRAGGDQRQLIKQAAWSTATENLDSAVEAGASKAIAKQIKGNAPAQANLAELNGQVKQINDLVSAGKFDEADALVAQALKTSQELDAHGIDATNLLTQHVRMVARKRHLLADNETASAPVAAVNELGRQNLGRETAEQVAAGGRPSSREALTAEAVKRPTKRIATPIKAFHGSPHDFDKFDASKIGTGEGAQAYGHGLYFAEAEGTARDYKRRLAGNPVVDSQNAFDGMTWLNPTTKGVAQHALTEAQQFGLSGDEAVKRAIQTLSDAVTPGMETATRQAHYDAANALGPLIGKEWTTNPGRMYEVALHAEPQQFLDWDKPLSGQSEGVRKALGALPSQDRSWTARQDGKLSFRGNDRSFGMIEPRADGKFDAMPFETGGNAPKMGTFATIEEAKAYIETHAVEPRHLVSNPNNTQALREAGIPGIRYKDQLSRGKEGGSYNYVVFPGAEDLIEIIGKDGKPLKGAEKAKAVKELYALQGMPLPDDQEKQKPRKGKKSSS